MLTQRKTGHLNSFPSVAGLDYRKTEANEGKGEGRGGGCVGEGREGKRGGGELLETTYTTSYFLHYKMHSTAIRQETVSRASVYNSSAPQSLMLCASSALLQYPSAPHGIPLNPS